MEISFISLLIIMLLVIVLAVVLPFADLGALRNRVRALLPGRPFETVYLKALVDQLGRTPALLVITGRDDTRRELNLLQAFSRLTLTSDENAPGRTVDVLPDDEPEIAVAPGRRVRRERKRTPQQPVSYALGCLLVQSVLLLPALLLLRWLLLSAEAGLHLTWPRVGGAVLLLLFWLLPAFWLHRALLHNLRAWWERRRECIADPGTPGAEIWRHPHLLIRGHPGSGKTTLLRHIAVVCANERLGWSRRWRRNRVRDAYGWPGRAPFPIYIPLRALSQAALQGTTPLLESYAATLTSIPILGAAVQHCPPQFFVQRMQQGGCLILLDAFDELRDAEARQRLGRLIAALPTGPARHPNRIVVTSRIVGYEGQLDGTGFVRRRVADLDDEQAAAFVQARYRALAALEQGVHGTGTLAWNPDQRAERLVRRLPDNPGLRRLSRNPLLLSLAVALHFKQAGRELPQERHLLYAKAIEMLAYEWERHKDSDVGLEPTDERGDLNQAEKQQLLQELAWAMFEQAPAGAAATAHAVTTDRRAQEVLALVLEQMPAVAAGKSGAERRRYCWSEAERWLRNLGQRGGVLQELGNVPGSSEVEIQFAHLTFQEYLAARAIDDDREAKRLRRLLERWNDPHWREVLLLYAAGRPDATPVVHHLLEQHGTAAQLLAGYVLVERPRHLEQRWLDQAVAQLRWLAFATTEIAEETAREALQILADAAALPEGNELLPAVTGACYPAVRGRIIEILATALPGRPAAQPIPPDVQALARHVLEQEPDYRPRIAAGFALARSDPRYDGDGWIPELVEIPAGPFLMGSSDADNDADSDEKPQHEISLPTYSIGKTLVTNAQWRRFIAQGGYTTRDYWTAAGWQWREQKNIRQPEFWDNPKFNGDNQPVVGVSWYEAVAYCRWLSDATGQAFYLPSEAEWEKAARGPDGRIYPWGNVWEPGYCNSKELDLGQTAPVGSFPAGTSPYGALDMAGNVWEWCATKYGKKYPYTLEPEWEAGYLEGTVARRLRGGNYYLDRTYVRCAHRNDITPLFRSFLIIGLRVARRSPHPGSDA
jgi:formylglycine-generating enzyme required for sulfatase activity/energy-coupling factor transporter ATP-binding protein EcfA2